MERNPAIPFTYQYSQPEEYHFSIDSVEMPWEVAQSIKARISEGELSKKQLKQWQILDLCAGCGVLGFELQFHLPELCHIDFVEVQAGYQIHFEHNKKLALEKAKNKKPGLRLVGTSDTANNVSLSNDEQMNFQFHLMNYEGLLGAQFQKKYDLILCNPPYFVPEQGKLSPSEFKNRCRFFMDSSFEKLIEVIAYALSPHGEAYFLLRDLSDHSIDLFQDLRRFAKGRLQIENLAMIRGTFLLKMMKEPPT